MYVIIMYYFYEHVCLYHFLNTMLGAERVKLPCVNHVCHQQTANPQVKQWCGSQNLTNIEYGHADYFSDKARPLLGVSKHDRLQY